MTEKKSMHRPDNFTNAFKIMLLFFFNYAVFSVHVFLYS